ncbi:DUF4186 domain-containing protein [Candidatus Burkholderia verschuerenii]|uniref:DUF4186 domain-containing protein n=1 Tax=Candidatus Burkholderia verschuerenii TaxID=242163 RepID=UPI000AA49B02|nr:DUF4186 domain-containing protein [Candidatus Burkholderia verschuerenii]
MRDLDAVFDALAKSAFRRRFALGVREGRYLRERGMRTVIAQAHELIAKRLAPQLPLNDGKQTPMRGHPVFIAQHATATCCRSCLAKWHGIAPNTVLDDAERDHVRRGYRALAARAAGFRGRAGNRRQPAKGTAVLVFRPRNNFT